MNIIFSYDCEGNWGFVDWENQPLNHIKPDDLSDVYKFLADMHMEHEIPASFGFVGLYVTPIEERKLLVLEELDDLNKIYPNLLEYGGLWEGYKNLSIINDISEHTEKLIEVCCHSTTHIPHNLLNEYQRSREFELSKFLLKKRIGYEPESYIYARNKIYSKDICMKHFKSFRDTPSNNFHNRVSDLFKHLTAIDIQKSKELSEFIYWKGGGPRKIFSDERWKRLWEKRISINKSRALNVNYHVWTHPHNFLTDPSLYDRFTWLMKLFNKNKEDLKFLTLNQLKPGNVK